MHPNLVTAMTLFNFELLLISPEDPSALSGDEFLDAVEDALFEAFGGDVTPAVAGGVPVLYCTVEAESPGEAFDKVWGKFAGAYSLPLGEAIVDKMRMNEGRPHRHGKNY